jgi:hypothetical protein
VCELIDALGGDTKEERRVSLTDALARECSDGFALEPRGFFYRLTTFFFAFS